MKLPLDFLNKMEKLLGPEEYDEFIESYDMPRYYGLRVNTLKISVDEFKKISPFEIENIPWVKEGFYYTEKDNPGKHPYYYAGLYYIQEPSAMFPGVVIDARPGEKILDLCAAPGGKTVQMAAAMKGEGLIVANDISSERTKALVKNIELSGVRNAIVTNETPQNLASKFIEYFDKILIDAPCSGEGMFRKDPDAARSWEKFKCEKCSGMQWEILQQVDIMLKPGGIIVYSTCTFSPEENEIMISRFLDKYKNYSVEEIKKNGGIDNGRPEWADGRDELKKTARLWPHKLKGEGHFVALLKKEGISASLSRKGIIKEKAKNIKEKTVLEAYRQFENENLNTVTDGFFNIKGSNLYCLPVEPPVLDGLKVAKFGWYLGELVSGRFNPSHSLAVSLEKADIKRTIDFPSASREVQSYLKGETLIVDGEKGITGVCVDGYTLGWGKHTGDILKNLYPKGWRKMG